jgi:hypothetical protein
MRKVIFATMVLMLLSSIGYGADWKYYFTDKTQNKWFYDTQSVFREQETTKVWVKDMLSNKGKKGYFKKFPSTPATKNISSDKGRWEINCSKNVVRNLSHVVLDSKGNVIQSEDFPNSKFFEAVTNSPVDRLVKIICKGK